MAAPLSVNDQLAFPKPLYMKVATGFCETVHTPPARVDSHMVIDGVLENSSKKMCGVPEASITMSANSELRSEPLTSAGALKGSPGPEECDSSMTEAKLGMETMPSVHVPEGRLQK